MHTSTNPTFATPGARRRGARLIPGLAVGLGTAVLVLAAPVAANAHVHVTPSSTEAGATSELAFSFSHGCDGSPTTAVEVTVPDAIASVALIANPGWDVASELVDGARTVVFTADEPMPDGVRETLEVEVTLPEDAADGTVLAFPALQVCETGETLWGDEDPDADAPAPTITIGQTAHAHGHGGAPQGASGGDGSDEATSDDAGSHDTDAEGAAPEGGASDGGGSESADAQAGQQGTEGSATPLAITALVVALLATVLAAIAVFRRRPVAQ